MKYVVVLLFMLFLHIVDDYYLQGILAQMKQKKWWEKNAPQKLYQYDYIMALFEHAFSWTFMIHLPLIYMYISSVNVSYFVILFAITWIIHAITDNAKANNLRISLVTDQSIHVIQIIVLWLFYIAIF